MMDTATIGRGMRVLIHGGAGTVGSAAVQLAKQQGLQVISTASGAGVDLVKSLGADEVIDYRQQRFQDIVRESGQSRGKMILHVAVPGA